MPCLLAKRTNGPNSWDRAALNGKKEILGTLWYLDIEVQINLKDDLLPAND